MRTVGGLLAGAIAKFLRHDVQLACAGRTDAGVHAWGQVAELAPPSRASIRVGCRRPSPSMLGPEVVIRAAELVEPRLGRRATRPAGGRIPLHHPQPSRSGSVPQPLHWWVPDPLDLRALRLAADPFVGDHDFASFCRKGGPGSSTARRVSESRWVDEGDGVLRYEIRANAFCWQMVRSLVGTLVEPGLGKRRPGDMMAILGVAHREAAGQVAPPAGPVPVGSRLLSLVAGGEAARTRAGCSAAAGR